MADLYLTPLPRGLHHVALEVIEKELSEFEVKLKLIDESVNNEEYCQYLQTKLKKRVGSALDERIKKHVSVGYHNEKKIWSTAGIWEGCVWLELETDAPVSTINNISVVGPLLACVRSWALNDSQTLTSTMEDAVTVVRTLVKEDYSFDKALGLWRRHAQVWPGELSDHDSLRYRVSCIRSHTKEYCYAREDFLRQVVDDVAPHYENWKVDLTNYDVEIVLIVLSPRSLAVALALRPYQLLGTKGFKCNELPTDVSPPYLSGKITTGITRLRPTNAHLLLEIANVEKGDVVLDPCAGIGTIPLYTKNGVGLGGDLSLTSATYATVVKEYIRKFSPNPNTNVCAWDAGALPIRTASIDVVVSDLPFGKQCLSSNKLYRFLPLWFCELARVLCPGTGRVVLLCGAYGIVVDALQSINGEDYKNWVVTSVFPVNIGGILAWIVMAKRTLEPPTLLLNHQRRLRKITAQRDQLERRTKSRKAECLPGERKMKYSKPGV